MTTPTKGKRMTKAQGKDKRYESYRNAESFSKVILLLWFKSTRLKSLDPWPHFIVLVLQTYSTQHLPIVPLLIPLSDSFLLILITVAVSYTWEHVIIFLKRFFYLYFWLHWVFVAAHGLALVVSGSRSPVAVCGLLIAVVSLGGEHGL